MSYLQVATIFVGKHKVHRIYHTNSRVDCERTISRIALGDSSVVVIMREVWSMAVPKVHHFSPIFRGKILPNEDCSTMEQNLSTVRTAELGTRG